MNLLNVLLVGIGGFAGSAARYLTVLSIEKRLNAVFPFGTLVVNLTGSFILGIVFGCIAGRTGVNEQWKLLFATGFCGGFTTFSAFAFENINLLQKEPSTAIWYITSSVAGGLLAVWAGMAVAKTLYP